MTSVPPEPPLPPPSDEPSGSGSATWDRVHVLFHEALELDAAARDVFLARIATADPELARELGSLLAAHEQASGFLDRPPAPAAARAVSPGEKIGPYRILEEIGHGGMGVVYRAKREDEHFTKEVAIKLIDPSLRSEEVLKRFRAERQILAMLDHPNIARLIDGGTARDGSPFLVMEHVSGTTLLHYCDERKLDVEDRLRLFLTVCDAVQFAHQRLVVHRDLKSDNVLVTEDGSPRLLDFGIAKLISPEGEAGDATRTAPMNRILTPDYASPEQVRGDVVTVAGDVYSLGVVLYELLSGSRPLSFKTRTPEEILRVVTQEDPPLPSSVVARPSSREAAERRSDTTARLRRRLTGDLDYVVLKALEKDPTRRYASVDQLSQDIRRHLDGRPVLARGRSTAYLVSRFVRRHRAALVAAALIAVSMVGGLAATTWQANVARRERDLAKRRFEDVRALAHAVMFDIHDAVANLPGSTKARELIVHHGLIYLDRLSTEAKEDQLLQREVGLAYAKIADVQGRPMFPNLGQTSQALASYDKALGLLAAAAHAYPESTRIVHDQVVVAQRKSDLLAIMGRHREAMQQALTARDWIRAQLARRPDDRMFKSDLCVTSQRLSDQKLFAADTLGALEECKVNQSIAEEFFLASPKDPGARRGALIAYAKMANLRAMLGHRDTALATYVRAEKLAEEAVAALPHDTDASRDLSVVYGMHGLFLADGGQFDSALVVYGLGMKITEELAAADKQNVLQQSDLAAGNFEIGTILMKARRYTDAVTRFGEAFTRFGTLTAADTGNAENRIFQARSSRAAGQACVALANQARSKAERTAWRARARSWMERSLVLYRKLERAGMLVGDDAGAPQEIDREMATLVAAG